MSECNKMSNCYYFKLYEHYKKKCKELSSENERLNSLIKKSCQTLLEEITQFKSDLSGSISETSSLISPTRSIESDNFEPGANKWECLTEEEMLTYMQPNTPPSPAQQTGCETVETPIKKRNASDLTPKRIRLQSVLTSQNQSPAAPSQKHICKLPRCKDHQPVFVSSIRKIQMLSPNSRRLATNKREKSPKGYWSLDMPSTQEIRDRNQD